MFYSLFRAFKFAFQQIHRNFWLTVVTITLLVLPLLLVNILLGLNGIAQAVTQSIKEKIDLSIYLKSEVTNEQAIALRDELLQNPAIQEIELTTKEGALERFKKRHANDPAILEALNELNENPFGAVLVVKANSLDSYSQILNLLNDPKYSDLIEEKDFYDYQTTIERVKEIMKNVQKFGIGVAAVFIIIAILIVFNTIRIAIYTHRDEIGVMRLVGATNWFIRGPYLVEALFLSFTAMIVTLVILFPSLNFLQPYINNLFAGMDVNLINYFNKNFIKFFGIQFLGISVLTLVSTAVAMRRYLKI